MKTLRKEELQAVASIAAKDDCTKETLKNIRIDNNSITATDAYKLVSFELSGSDIADYVLSHDNK